MLSQPRIHYVKFSMEGRLAYSRLLSAHDEIWMMLRHCDSDSDTCYRQPRCGIVMPVYSRRAWEKAGIARARYLTCPFRKLPTCEFAETVACLLQQVRLPMQAWERD